MTNQPPTPAPQSGAGADPTPTPTPTPTPAPATPPPVNPKTAPAPTPEEVAAVMKAPNLRPGPTTPKSSEDPIAPPPEEGESQWHPDLLAMQTKIVKDLSVQLEALKERLVFAQSDECLRRLRTAHMPQRPTGADIARSARVAVSTPPSGGTVAPQLAPKEPPPSDMVQRMAAAQKAANEAKKGGTPGT